MSRRRRSRYLFVWAALNTLKIAAGAAGLAWRYRYNLTQMELLVVRYGREVDDYLDGVKLYWEKAFELWIKQPDHGPPPKGLDELWRELQRSAGDSIQ